MVTIKDVARQAEVSVATVSRVFSGANVVSEETSKKIRDIAAALRYVPHSGARSLITSRTHTIGVLLPDLYGEFFSELIRGIDMAARRGGFHILVSLSHEERGEIEEAMRAMRGRVDGVLLMSPHADADSLRNVPSNLPVVLLCSALGGSDADSVTIQNFSGAKEMVAHLISLGHSRIAIIKGAAANYDSAERLRGYRAALRDSGLTGDRSLEVEGDFTEAGGHAAALRLLELERRPTAIFAANDSMAIGALSALRDAGVKVPDQMAVAGFDDIPLARYIDPPLSSVHVPIATLGERAMALLLDAIARKDGRSPRRERVQTSLVIRQSTGGNSARHSHARKAGRSRRA